MDKQGYKTKPNQHRQSDNRGFLNKRKPWKNRDKVNGHPKREKEAKAEITDQYIEDCSKLLPACQTNQYVKVQDTDVTFDRNVVLKDISLKMKGPKEDLVYAANKGIHVNIRRGLTLLFDKKTRKVSCVRRGLRKFYDLAPEYLDFNLGLLPSLEGKIGIKDAAEHKSIHRKIFGDLEQYMKNQLGGVSIVEMNKANGENCQISWVPEQSAWAISSKNVCMLLRTIEDLNLYFGDRFHFAEIIAREWFAILKRLKEEKVEAIKGALGDFTIIGEYVGNQTYQHLVKYERQTILFYSVVSKHSASDCMVPREAIALLKRLELDVVAVHDHPVCNSWIELNNKLKELNKEVNENPMEAREEGVVLYLVKKSNTGAEELVSLCKLKTLEYRIYRKLREKLRSLGEKKGSQEESLAKFKSEVTELVNTFKTPKELSFYFEVARRAFEFTQQHEEHIYLLFNQYVSFLSAMIYCTLNEVNFSLGFFHKSVLQELYNTPWSKYKELKGKLVVPDNHVIRVPRTIVFIPITIPGIGKTYLYNEVIKPYCEENGLMVRYVSSDKIREAEMQILKSKDMYATESALFSQTRDSANEAFDKMLVHYLKEKSLEDKVIFIDKNHPPNGIRKTIEFINKNKTKFADVRLIALLPKTKSTFTIRVKDNDVVYPFSAETCLNCLMHVQIRKNHETLNGKGVDSAAVLLMFYNMFRDFKTDQTTFKDFGFNGNCAMEFFNEGVTFSQQAIDKLKEILQELPNGNDKPKNIQLMDQLLGLCQDQLFQIEKSRPSKADHKKTIAAILTKLPLDRPVPPPSILTKVNPVSTANSTAVVQANVKETVNSGKYWIEATKDSETRLKSYETSPPLEVNNKKGFKPKKAPIFIGVFLKTDEKARLLNLIRYTSLKVQDHNSEALVNDDVAEFLGEELKTWKWPETQHHLTTLYLGSDKAKQNLDAYKQFEEGINHPIKLKHIVYVPGKIIIGVVFLNKALIKVENRFPHVTIALKNTEANLSNTILEAMFGGIFLSKYESGLKSGSDKVSSLNLNINGENLNAFLFEFPADVVFEAETKAYAP
jgi:hypothetical protein